MRWMFVIAAFSSAGCSQVHGYQPRGGATLVTAQPAVATAPARTVQVSREVSVHWQDALDELLLEAARSGHLAVSDASVTWQAQYEGAWHLCSAEITTAEHAAAWVIRNTPVCSRDGGVQRSFTKARYDRQGRPINQREFIGMGSPRCTKPVVPAVQLPGTEWLPHLQHVQCRPVNGPTAGANAVMLITALAH